MNDTPETDAQLTTFTSISKLKKHFVNRTGTVSADFARGLEQERNKWRDIAVGLHPYAAAFIHDYTPDISKDKGRDILWELVDLNSSHITRHLSLVR